jgi:hypothetical protein
MLFGRPPAESSATKETKTPPSTPSTATVFRACFILWPNDEALILALGYESMDGAVSRVQGPVSRTRTRTRTRTILIEVEGELFAGNGFGVGDVDVAGGKIDDQWDGGVDGGGLGGEKEWIQREVALGGRDAADGDGGGAGGAEGDGGGKVPIGGGGGSGDGDERGCAEFQGESGIGTVVGGVAE